MRRLLRLIAILLVFGGAGAAFVWPQLVMRHSGEQLGRLTVYERGGLSGGRWTPGRMRLSPGDNPMRLVVEARFLPGRKFERTTTGLRVSIAAAGSIVMEGVFDVPLPQQSLPDGKVPVSSLATPDFAVDTQDLYTLSASPVETGDLNFQKVDLVLRSDVEVPDTRYRTPAIAAMGLGVLLLLFGSGRPASASRQGRAPKKKQKRNWGRTKK